MKMEKRFISLFRFRYAKAQYMILIVGLGNPSKKFEKTRHNVGFRVVNEFAKKNNFPDFKISKKFNALISEGEFNNEKVILAKSQTFMNLSGKAVKKLVSSFRFQVSGLWVVHDDIDLPLGKIRIVKNRSSAGHKGVESIIRAINSKNFVRFRIGILPKTGKPKNLEKFVLQKPSKAKPSEAEDETKSQRPFNKDEEKIIKEVTQKTVEEIEFSLKEGLEKAMAKFNNEK